MDHRRAKALARGMAKRMRLYEPIRRLAEALRNLGTWRRGLAEKRASLSFYLQFLHSGDLCFDIGANSGNRVETFLKCGASVVAVEPQRYCADQLKRGFGRDKRLTLV